MLAHPAVVLSVVFMSKCWHTCLSRQFWIYIPDSVSVPVEFLIKAMPHAAPYELL